MDIYRDAGVVASGCPAIVDMDDFVVKPPRVEPTAVEPIRSVADVMQVLDEWKSLQK